MIIVVSEMYGYFCSPNSPIFSNHDLLGLVNKYKELIQVHHTSILTMLNADKNKGQTKPFST